MLSKLQEKLALQLLFLSSNAKTIHFVISNRITHSSSCCQWQLKFDHVTLFSPQKWRLIGLQVCPVAVVEAAVSNMVQTTTTKQK